MLDKRALVMLMLLVASTAGAQGIEEVIVTSHAVRDDLPGTYLRRQGDYLVQRVDVSNDSREAEDRVAEIHTTLRAALAMAQDSPVELSVVQDNDVVLPLQVDAATIVLAPTDRQDTASTTISVKISIPERAADGQALIGRLMEFVDAVEGSGRTLLEPVGTPVVSIVDPNRYRGNILKLLAEDVDRVVALLGDDYRVVVTGVDRGVSWVRLGLLDLGLYIPYEYVVVPTSISSIPIY